MAATAIDITTLKRAVASVDKEIKYSPLTMGYERLAALGINVLTDMEYENIFYRGLLRGGNAFAYDANMARGDQKEGKLGAIKQRTMKTEIVKALIPDNINAYREKEPLGDGLRIDAENAPVTFERINEVKNTFVNDLVRNIFVGIRSTNKADQDGYHAINGLFQTMREHISAGEISVGLGNMVQMESWEDLKTLEAGGADMDKLIYTYMKKFRDAWNYNFRENIEQGGKGVCWYLTTKVFDHFVEGYKKNYQYQNLENVHNPGYKFIGWDGITFYPTNLMGEGLQMFVTIPDNLDMGLNTKSTEAGVKVTEDFLKPDDIWYHIMSCVGTRVRYIEPSCFIMNDQSNTIIRNLGTDYENSDLMLSSNDDTMGTAKVTTSGYTTAASLKDIAAGITLHLKAEAKSGYQFVQWSNGCKLAEQDIVTPGTPVAYQAIFAPVAGA